MSPRRTVSVVMLPFVVVLVSIWPREIALMVGLLMAFAILSLVIGAVCCALIEDQWIWRPDPRKKTDG